MAEKAEERLDDSDLAADIPGRHVKSSENGNSEEVENLLANDKEILWNDFILFVASL